MLFFPGKGTIRSVFPSDPITHLLKTCRGGGKTNQTSEDWQAYTVIQYMLFPLTGGGGIFRLEFRLPRSCSLASRGAARRSRAWVC